MKSLRKIKEENGATLVFVALFMVVLLGMAAIVIDGGRLYLEKSNLQKALDAGVLGSAQILRIDPVKAKTIAMDISSSNKVVLQESNLTATNDYIKATKKIIVPMSLAKFIGFNEVPVSAAAKAIVAPLKTGFGMAPIAVAKSVVENGGTNLKCTNTGAQSGNCGFLDLDGSGAKSISEQILAGSGTLSVGENLTVDTQPGQVWSDPIRDAFQSLINKDKSDASKSYCQDPSTADASCNRVIFVGVIESWADVTGKENMEIIGLVAFWIKEVGPPNEKSIIGEFLPNLAAPGEIGDPGSVSGGYKIYGVKLDE